jgi:hypothetical protein
MAFLGITPTVPKPRSFRDSSNHRTISQNILSSIPVSWPGSDSLSVSVNANTQRLLMKITGYRWICDSQNMPEPDTLHEDSSHPRARVENVHNPTTHSRIPECQLSELRWTEGKVIKPNSFW